MCADHVTRSRVRSNVFRRIPRPDARQRHPESDTPRGGEPTIRTVPCACDRRRVNKLSSPASRVRANDADGRRNERRLETRTWRTCRARDVHTTSTGAAHVRLRRRTPPHTRHAPGKGRRRRTHAPAPAPARRETDARGGGDGGVPPVQVSAEARHTRKSRRPDGGTREFRTRPPSWSVVAAQAAATLGGTCSRVRRVRNTILYCTRSRQRPLSHDGVTDCRHNITCGAE